MLPLAVVDDAEVVAAAAVSSSFLAHDPRSAIVPNIKTIQNSIFFIITSFIIDAGLFLHLCVWYGVKQHRNYSQFT
jgi:hypothetical protein